MADIYIFEIDRKLNINSIEESLIPSILSHCKLYKEHNAYIESVFAWSKLLYLLKNQYHLSNLEFDFSKRKPRLLNCNLYFNISHSSSLCALIIANSECSVDIQKKFLNQRLENKMISEEEKEEYLKTNDKIDYLNRKWVIKEAQAKKEGNSVYSLVRERSNIDLKEAKVINYGDDIYYLFALADEEIIYHEVELC